MFGLNGGERERESVAKRWQNTLKRDGEQESAPTYLSAVDHTALSSVSMSEAQREYGAGLQGGGWRVFTLFFSNKKA